MSSTPIGGRGVSTAGLVGIVIDTVTIWLDSTTIRDAARALGSGESALKWMSEGAALLGCFETTAADRAFISLHADPRSSERVVTVDIDRDRPPASLLPQCAPLAIPASRIGTTVGLRLGMSRREVGRLLGAPRSVEDGVAHHAIPSPPGQIAPPAEAGGTAAKDRTVYLSLAYRDEVLVNIYVSQGNELIAESMR